MNQLNYPSTDQLPTETRNYLLANNSINAIRDILNIGVSFKLSAQQYNAHLPLEAVMRRELSESITSILAPLSQNTELQNQALRDITSKIEELGIKRDHMTAMDQAFQKTTHSGTTFEAQLISKVRKLFGKECIISDVSLTTGYLTGRKTGDCTAEFTDDHACAGHGVVFEAKNEAGLTIHKAAAELELAKRNRRCDRGIFVFGAHKAPSEFVEPLIEKDCNIYVKWSPDDNNTDALLVAAFYMAKKSIIVPLISNSGPEIDYRELEGTVTSIEQAIDLLVTTTKNTETITSANDRIKSGINKVMVRLKLDHAALERLWASLSHSKSAD